MSVSPFDHPLLSALLGDDEVAACFSFAAELDAMLAFERARPAFACRVLTNSGDLAEAARNLFAALRELDASGADCIVAEPAPEQGLGRAINDRLRRAAAARTGS